MGGGGSDEQRGGIGGDDCNLHTYYYILNLILMFYQLNPILRPVVWL